MFGQNSEEKQNHPMEQSEEKKNQPMEQTEEKKWNNPFFSMRLVFSLLKFEYAKY